MSWWWCLDHSQVEENLGCGGQKRLGPYPTADRAALALQRINKREAEDRAAEERAPKKRA